MANQAVRLKIRSTKGPAKNKTEEAFWGTGFSFKISLRASASGCKIPKNPVQLGPFLFCILARTFRSKRVKKATVKIMFKIK